MRICASLLLVLFFWAPRAEAACSGSGRTWRCTAGTSSSQLASALNSASDGATITFDSGSYSWNQFVSFSNSKGATLICESPGTCTVNVSGTVLGMNGNLSGTNTRLYRISGFKFSGGNAFVIWFYGQGTLTQVRIDHNTFTGQASDNTLVFFGENSTVANFYGVLDHNTVTNSSSVAFLQMIGDLRGTPLPSPFGTANNMFVENNTITISNQTNPGLGCMDSWGGAAIVWRHNTTTNCLVTAHGATHAGGPSNLELYDNRLIVNSGAHSLSDCYRCFHHQGSGEFIAFNNQFTASGGKSGNAISMADYRAYPRAIDGGDVQCDGTVAKDGNRSPTTTYRGYPCWHQPGRDFSGRLKPMYVWNNTWSGTSTQIDMYIETAIGGSPDYTRNHLQDNRDYYNAVSASAQTSRTSPFNGASGMGFGTLANRPSTCTTGSESGGGVGYFATDAGPAGTLYRCSATNTWTVHYQPYTYPHPLVTGGGSTTTPPPSAPSNVRIIK